MRGSPAGRADHRSLDLPFDSALVILAHAPGGPHICGVVERASGELDSIRSQRGTRIDLVARLRMNCIMIWSHNPKSLMTLEYEIHAPMYCYELFTQAYPGAIELSKVCCYVPLIPHNPACP